MHFSVGKPILAMVSVACIAVPAGTLDATAAASTGSTVQIAAAAPLAVGAEPSLLDILSFPYHNAYGIAVGVGTAANAGLQLALLPVSIVSFVAVNKTDLIPAYIQTVQKNLANAIPGIIKAIQTEVAYDQNLFGQLGGGSATQLALKSDPTVTAAADVTSSQLLNLLTFPVHNAYGLAVGFGTAANAVLQLALLPVSIASFVAVNKTDQIPAYIQTVQKNLANAIPTIIKAVQTEVDYDRNLFGQLGSVATATTSSTQLSLTSAAEPRSSATEIEAKATSTEPAAAEPVGDKDVEKTGTTPKSKASTLEKLPTETPEKSGSTPKPVEEPSTEGTKAADDEATKGTVEAKPTTPHTTANTTANTTKVEPATPKAAESDKGESEGSDSSDSAK
ncbi:hypothetical protein [Mycobacterium sp. URHB0044]|uniref:hypothetical protein n=1 Tax=Mycobacterium sp. URHB0044 TaxID=1380386 RepID=UPI00048CDC02|nr:hypothetical protein [Mycobacterium sp. URHB0044]